MNNLKFIDCHSHPHDKKFVEAGVNTGEMMQDLLLSGGGTIAIGTDYTEIEKALIFARKYENCWATIGIHPADNHMEEFSEEKFEGYIKNFSDKIVGIGECGLDYYYFNSDTNIDEQKNRQKELFISQVQFALKLNLPLVVHGRPSKNSMDAYRDILDILENFPGVRGHAHFFVGNIEIAERFLKLGFLMSFDGPITFTSEYDNVIKFLPIESIMIETDSPYAAPAPHRGQLNFPKYVKFVAKKIAELKGLTEDEVLEITKNNTVKLFNLS